LRVAAALLFAHEGAPVLGGLTPSFNLVQDLASSFNAVLHCSGVDDDVWEMVLKLGKQGLRASRGGATGYPPVQEHHVSWLKAPIAFNFKRNFHDKLSYVAVSSFQSLRCHIPR
jgi:hypothetical protein